MARLGPSDEVGAEDALDPEQAREEAIAAVLDAARAASRASRLSCPCEWEAAGLVPPSMTPEDLEMAVYDALMEFGDPNGSRDAADIEGPDAGAAPRRAANKHVKSAFSSSNGRPVGASPFKHKKHRADDLAMGDVQGAGGCPNQGTRQPRPRRFPARFPRKTRIPSSRTSACSWAPRATTSTTIRP